MEKKLCPMRKKVLQHHNIIEEFEDCIENRCAWWVIDRCAIPQIAVQLAVAAMELAERGNKE